MNYCLITSLFIVHCSLFTVSAYRIEISNPAIADIPVFIAGYYGDRVFVVDSTMADTAGYAVFERDYDLCTGIYTLVAPGKLQYDLLLDAVQQLRISWLTDSEIRIEGDEQAVAWAKWTNAQSGTELGRQITGQYPGTFLGAYLTALQPVEMLQRDTTVNISQMMTEYRYLRSNFFANMPLSDVRMLHTPLYREKVYYYLTKFVTQQTDSLIFIAYSMLEQALGNYETFFYISDFLMDFGLRYRDIQNIQKLYDFVRRNRDMLGTKGMEMLQPRLRSDYFALPDEISLKNRLKNMPLTGVDGLDFNSSTINSLFRVFYFWKNNCVNCITDVPRLKTVVEKYENRCFGIAVNIENDVLQPENRILAYDPLFVNVSTANMPTYETSFFADYYSKIILTDTVGNIVGIFASIASLDSFLRISRERTN